MKKAFVFDFDDTLATTTCEILVKKNGSSLSQERLTPAEFNTHVLPYGQYYDFSQFKTESFIHNAKPTSLIELAKEVHDEGHSVYILTARHDSVAKAITEWLLGFEIKPVGVHGVGGDNINIAKEKQRILTTIKECFDLVYFYDDDQHNIELAEKCGVKTYLV